MPFYEYECQACGQHHEAMQKMSEAPLRKCPHCGKPKLKRLISAPVFRLKGSGWYETDFKSDKDAKRNLHADEKPEKAEPAAKDAKAAGPADAGGAAKAEPAKSEPKAEPKTEPKAEPKAGPKPTPKSTRGAAPKRPAKAAGPGSKPARRR
jgi:putative FmdB family regulatory protein